MKNIFLSLLFVFLFLINPVNSDEKISFIDMDKVISTSNPGLSILKQLTNINNKNSTILNKKEIQLKEKEKKLITQKNIISEADFQNKVNELKSEVNTYNINRKKMIEKFNQLKVENTNNLLKLINPILTKYSNKNKISIILQKKNLIIGKSELDITDEIIKIINNEITDFKIK
jgi:outer membrane protein